MRSLPTIDVRAATARLFCVVLLLLAGMPAASCSPHRAARKVVQAMTRESASDKQPDSGQPDSEVKARNAKVAD